MNRIHWIVLTLACAAPAALPSAAEAQDVEARLSLTERELLIDQALLTAPRIMLGVGAALFVAAGVPAGLFLWAAAYDPIGLAIGIPVAAVAITGLVLATVGARWLRQHRRRFRERMTDAVALSPGAAPPLAAVWSF